MKRQQNEEQHEMYAGRYSRQRRRDECRRAAAYQALSGRAEIELAFHRSDTVRSWLSRWASVLCRYDLDELFFRWIDSHC
ncbi:hypothetical protein AZH90_004285 [Salmonella enterica subsp. enterica serovar Legon]|nr:hypothetical protein [Salmonella enterica subsp. enterica serovar Legon]EDW9825356.1 hypothetical protein [Salmonella enterica]